MNCPKCGCKLVSYITDPDVVEDFCPKCDKIPGGAKPSAWPSFIDLITPKDEVGSMQ